MGVGLEKSNGPLAACIKDYPSVMASSDVDIVPERSRWLPDVRASPSLRHVNPGKVRMIRHWSVEKYGLHGALPKPPVGCGTTDKLSDTLRSRAVEGDIDLQDCFVRAQWSLPS